MLKRVRLKDLPECSDAFVGLVCGVLWQTPMKVLLDVFGARAGTALVLLKDLFVPARVRKAEVDGAGKGFPHLPA